MAAHYFGAHWPKNFINAFRRERVSDGFARLRADGFNTVILVVSWGDFQPVIEPCCGYDERAFDRLHFLLDQAGDAGLQVILRIGYIWSFHPESGAAYARGHMLMNREKVQAAYMAYLKRLGEEISHLPHVALSFLTWEDQWLLSIEPEARDAFEDYASLLPANIRPQVGGPLPRPDDYSAGLFHGYWDWLVMYRLFNPARELIPHLSYEARIDKEPYYSREADGELKITQWLDHRGMYRQPGSMPVTVYWAPFWGAQNTGEKLDADQAIHLFTAMLDEAREFTGGRLLFIDQFNIVDNTVGHESNATIHADNIDTFLDLAVCEMKQRGVIGYGYWTSRDYRESPLYNPAFGYGLEGWALTRADGMPPELAVRSLASGDHELILNAGDQLTQSVTEDRGRLPDADDARTDRICVSAFAIADSDLLAYAADDSDPAVLRFPAGSISERCADVLAQVSDGRITLRLVGGRGASLRLRDVWLFDHVQYGGLYDDNGQRGPVRDAVKRLNRKFGEPGLPVSCRVN